MTTRISLLTDIEVLSAASRNSLEDYCHYLLSTLPADYAEFFAEPALPGKKVSVAILTDIAAQIEHAQLLETHPIAAMVATVAGRSTSERSKHESLKAWALLASLALTDRSPTVENACVRVRRLACKEDRWLFDELLKTKSELGAVVRRLADLLRKHSGKSEESQSKYRKVSGLHALFADLHYRREKRGPGVGGQLVAGPTIVERLVATQVDSCLFPDVENARILNDELSLPGPRNGAEVRSTSERYLDGVANDDYPTVLKRRVLQGRQLAQS
ncbi:MAG: hypothetical protein HKN35_12035, partial [Woeseia sp.]|nr:hypothetical protein [Woeseia sp.]